MERGMTIDEAIYCMRSYLPGEGFRSCEDCPYHPSKTGDDSIWTCRSNEAHELAIAALKVLKKE